MIYIDSDNTNYKYLVSASDNYVVLSRSSSIDGTWDNPDTINVLYQYFTPSVYSIKTTYTSTSSRSFSDVSSQFATSIYDRSDFPILFVCNFLTLFLFGFILNQLTKLVKKGGVFGSN